MPAESKSDSKRKRPGFDWIYMHLAEALSQRSTCSRLQVGTVITSTDFRKVLAVGYNGNATGLPNCCDRDEVGNCGCLHSEENAVINCDSPRFIEKYVFVTHLPCVACAKRLINLGNVKRVYYGQEYRSRDSVELFSRVGIEVMQINSESTVQPIGGNL
jgi:dCMP deaminase